MKWASNRDIHIRLSQSWTLQEHFNDVHQLQCGSDEPGRAETWFLIMPWSIDMTFCPAVAAVYTLHDWCTATGGHALPDHTRETLRCNDAVQEVETVCALIFCKEEKSTCKRTDSEAREKGLFSDREVRAPAWTVVQQELHRSATTLKPPA